MRFKNRQQAGELLGEKLKADYANRSDVIVLALPRGGVPVAAEVAIALDAPLDVWIVRKLGTPGQEEMAIGAIASGNIRVMNKDLIRELRISDEAIARVMDTEKRELKRREQLYRHDRPAPHIEGQTVILVDDGLATGATMWAAVTSVQQKHPARVVIAVPVASAEACAEFERFVDEMVCYYMPPRFGAVGAWYKDFPQTSDEEVQTLLQQVHRETAS